MKGEYLQLCLRRKGRDDTFMTVSYLLLNDNKFTDLIFEYVPLKKKDGAEYIVKRNDSKLFSAYFHLITELEHESDKDEIIKLMRVISFVYPALESVNKLTNTDEFKDEVKVLLKYYVC